MKAMIFAAGLGTRLRPLTNDRPKALVELEGKTLLEIVIKRLVYHGFTDIVVNVHHFADKVIQYLKDHNNFGVNIMISDERDMLLETGGGLKKAANLLQGTDPILICNVDILTNINYSRMLDVHRRSKAIATLAIRQRTTSRYLLFNQRKNLIGWTNNKTGEVKISKQTKAQPNPFAFSGIQIIQSKFLELIHQTGKFSIIDVYLDLARTHQIKGYQHDNDVWLDVGKPESLKKGLEVLPLLFD